jgi:hypothetical protein
MTDTDTMNMNMNMSTNENMTTGQRIVREAMEPEEVQLGQITLNGGYVYDVCWLPGEGAVRIETGLDRKGRPDYLCYPDTFTIGSTLAEVIGCDEEKIRIWGLKIFNDKGVTDALSYETRRFKENIWYDYASEGYAFQVHVQLRCDHAEYDGSCCPETCGRGMTDTAFRTQLAKVVAENQALESLKQYSSDAETEPEQEEAAADGEETEAASEADDEEAEKAAILAAARTMWQRWAQNEDVPEEARAMWQRWAEEEATPETEPEAEPEPDVELEMALKDEESYDFIEARLRDLIILLAGFLTAMLLVHYDVVGK